MCSAAAAAAAVVRGGGGVGGDGVLWVLYMYNASDAMCAPPVFSPLGNA